MVTGLQQMTMQRLAQGPEKFEDEGDSPMDSRLRQEECLLTVEEVAALLSVSPITIYNWCYERRIPHMKPSRSVLRFRREDMENWVSARMVPENGRYRTKVNGK